VPDERPRAPQPQPAHPASAGPPPEDPQLALRIHQAIALLRSRDLRLVAD